MVPYGPIYPQSQLFPGVPRWCSRLRIWCCCSCGCRSQLQLRFDSWPRNFHMPQGQGQRVGEVSSSQLDKLPLCLLLSLLWGSFLNLSSWQQWNHPFWPLGPPQGSKMSCQASLGSSPPPLLCFLLPPTSSFSQAESRTNKLFQS